MPQEQFEYCVSFIFACADVSFHMISFQGSVCINILSPEMKNDRSEITPAMSFISGYFMQTVKRDWPDIELKIQAFYKQHFYKQRQTEIGKKASKF